MRVLYLIRGVPDESGTSMMFRRLSAYLPLLMARGVTPVVYTICGSSWAHEKLIERGYRIEALAAGPLAAIPFAGARLARLLRSERFDLIHASEVPSALVAGLARRIAPGRTPVAFFRHHDRGSRKLHLASRWAARLSDVTLVPSEAVARSARELDGTPSSRIRLVLSGVGDLRRVGAPELLAARQSLGISEEAAVIGAVSRLRTEKGLDLLIRAVVSLRGTHPGPLHLVVAGDGPERSRLESLAATQLGDAWHFVGHTNDIALWHSLLDVAVMPSRHEAFGLAGLEAMAASKPLVATRVGGLPEVVAHGETGFLVPPEDPVALAGALKQVLEDPDQRSRMGAAARERYLRLFTLDQMADRLTTTWREVLDETSYT